MEEPNILLKKVPDRASNIAVGITILIITFIVSAVLFINFVLLGFLQFPKFGGNYIPETPWIISGAVFIFGLILGIRKMIKAPDDKKY